MTHDMPETIYAIHNGSASYTSRADDYHLKKCGGTKYTRSDKYEALKQSHARLRHLLENYTFLDEGMDSSTRPEIYAESKKALAKAEKVSK